MGNRSRRANEKICLSISERTVAGVKGALSGVRFAEVRIDMLERPTVDAVGEIFSSHSNLIATCRAGRVPYQARRRLLGQAIESGAALVDVELEMNRDYKDWIISHAREKACTPMVSHHDFNRTPPLGELKRIVERCFLSGAEIAKVACKVVHEKDNDALLSLLDMERRMVVVGMGELGRESRILAPLLGAEFTFACLGSGRETAPGQLSIAEMREILRVIGGFPLG